MIRSETSWGSWCLQWGQRTHIMGIINLSHDSFSGDGLLGDAAQALAQARRFVDEGADILDIGGESTRPGYTPVEESLELQRVLPAITAIAAAVHVPISIDTRRPKVARAALEAGAHLINTVDATLYNTAMFSVAVEYGVPIVLMHYNKQAVPCDSVINDILATLKETCYRATEAGIPATHQIIDPGIGFGKETEVNLAVLRHLDVLMSLDRPLLVGPSRKRFIGTILGTDPQDRLEGTAAAVALAISRGADIVRVHDVHAIARVAKVADAICRTG